MRLLLARILRLRAAGPVGPRSLSARLLLGSAVATALALAVVLVLMREVLFRFVTGQIDQRLDDTIAALASQVRVAADGSVSLDGQGDGPPFDRRHHLSVWMVRGPRNAVTAGWLAPGELAAPSAAQVDEAMARPEPPPPEPGGPDTHPRTMELDAIKGVASHARVARTTVSGAEITILAAAPRAAIVHPVGEAMARIALGVLALGAALAGIALAQVRLGLRPLATLRRQVAEIGEGRRDALPEAQPREVAPLVSEMNLLLSRHAANLEKARRNVANLAHGLRTPLATLQLGLDRLEGPGKDDLRLLLAQVDDRLRHHLGRARAAALSGPTRSRTPLAPCLHGIGEALRRIHADRGVALAIRCPDDLVLAVESDDLDEVFGNLLDNAFKFAATRVECVARREERHGVVEISDDGPGIGADKVALVQQPGRRLDEQVPGFGFGLTIVREIVELHGGDLRLAPGQRGLLAVVRLPAAGREQPAGQPLTSSERDDSGWVSGTRGMPTPSETKELSMVDDRMDDTPTDGTAAGAAGGSEARPAPAAPSRFGRGALGSTRLRMGAAMALLAAAAAGAGAATIAQRGRAVTLVALAPQPISTLKAGAMAAAKGEVAEIYGGKFVVQDPSGRALVETGPRGDGGALVAMGEAVTVQGRFERGSLHAAAITHADGHVDALDPPPPPHPPHRGDAGAADRPVPPPL